MRQYEVTFIVDPVLSGDEIKSTAQAYLDMLQQEGCTVVHTDEMGLRQLAYPIKKRNSGVYYCVEFQSESGSFIPKVELAMSRDERIMRFLTVALDKFGVKYNDDKRKGLIGKKERKAAPVTEVVSTAPLASAPASVTVPIEEEEIEAVTPVIDEVTMVPVEEAPIADTSSELEEETTNETTKED